MSDKILSVEDRLEKYWFSTLGEFHNIFKSENECNQYLALLKWNGMPKCVFCEYAKIYSIKDRKTGLHKLYKCGKCRKQFTMRIGTIFQDSPISLKNLLMLTYLWIRNKGVLTTGIFEKGALIGSTATRFLVEEKLKWLFKFIDVRKKTDFEVFETAIRSIVITDRVLLSKSEFIAMAGHMDDVDIFDRDSYDQLVSNARFRIRSCTHFFIQDFATPEDVVAQFFIEFSELNMEKYDGGDIARGIWRAADHLWMDYIKHNYKIRAEYEIYKQEYSLNFKRRGRKKLAHWYLMNLARARHSERTTEELKQQIDLLLNIKADVAMKRSKKKEYIEPDFIRH